MSERCSMGVGCDEYGRCYASAHGEPDSCPLNKQRGNDIDTSKKKELLALADRVDAENTREVDAAIFRALGSPLPPEFAGKKIALTFNEARSSFFMEIGEMVVRYEPPKYTSSIDTALQIVPTGWTVANFSQGDDGGWWCELRRGHLTSYSDVVIAGCKIKTPAQAMASAALRALAVLED